MNILQFLMKLYALQAVLLMSAHSSESQQQMAASSLSKFQNTKNFRSSLVWILFWPSQDNSESLPSSKCTDTWLKQPDIFINTHKQDLL